MLLERLRKRLELGQRQYGDLNGNLLTHNWRKEALEEALDLSIYLGVLLQERDAFIGAVDKLLEAAQITSVEDAWQGVGMVSVPIRTLIDVKVLREVI